MPSSSSEYCTVRVMLRRWPSVVDLHEAVKRRRILFSIDSRLKLAFVRPIIRMSFGQLSTHARPEVSCVTAVYFGVLLVIVTGTSTQARNSWISFDIS
jgi:hypothetical protein